jgi:hypothetical protein
MSLPVHSGTNGVGVSIPSPENRNVQFPEHRVFRLVENWF